MVGSQGEASVCSLFVIVYSRLELVLKDRDITRAATNGEAEHKDGIKMGGECF